MIRDRYNFRAFGTHAHHVNRLADFREPTDEELDLARRVARLTCLGDVVRFEGYFDKRSRSLVIEVQQRMTAKDLRRLENPALPS